MTPLEKRNNTTHRDRLGKPTTTPTSSPPNKSTTRTNLPASSTFTSSLSPPKRQPRSSSVASSRLPLAPPPRAALSGASSPAPDSERERDRSRPTLHPNPNPSNHRAVSPAPQTQPPSTVATTSSLQQHDARLTHLEQQLSSLMDNNPSPPEPSSVSYWQTRCLSLEKKLSRSQDDCELLKSEIDAKDEEIDKIRAAWQVSRSENQRREEEIQELRTQIRGLKEFVSNSGSTRLGGGELPTSDEVFGEGMARLGNGLQNWVLVNFRRSKIDLSKADEATITELGRLVPMYEELASTSKIHLLQSLVSRLLVELVFDSYLVGLPSEEARQLQQTEALLASYAAPLEAINQWRSLTLTILRKDSNEKLQTETPSVTNTIVTRVNGLLDAITTTRSSDARDQGLKALVSSAVDLSRLLAVQKAVFNVHMPEILPHQRIMFDAETMEDIGGEDEDSLIDREICCVTFPGIIKRGDESGGHLQYRNVISKTRVLCTPE